MHAAFGASKTTRRANRVGVDWAEPAPGFDHHLQTLMTYGFGKRILFGSDQMVWPDATAQAIARFQAAPYLSAEQKRGIFFNNACACLVGPI